MVVFFKLWWRNIQYNIIREGSYDKLYFQKERQQTVYI